MTGAEVSDCCLNADAVTAGNEVISVMEHSDAEEKVVQIADRCRRLGVTAPDLKGSEPMCDGEE